MNKIQELIKELCPNGVEWKKLGDLCKISTGKGITKKDEVEGGEYPIISGGINPMGFFHSCNRKANTITVSRVGANAGFVNFIKRDFYLNDKCFSVVPSDTTADMINVIFLYYFLKYRESIISELQSEGGVPTINTQKLSSIEIPLPPLSVQTEIVRILDKFVEQQEQLEKLIELRKKQYEYYREEMLTAKEGEEWETKTLGECCKILKGKYITQKDSKPGPYPVVLGGQEPAYYIDEFNHSGEVIAVSRSGVSAGFISYWNQDIFVSDGFMLEPLDCSFKYLYMYLKSKQESINSLKRGAGIPHITTEHLKELVIPIFPSSKENEIVNALDSFESSISALTSALELSKKRYEHYRDEMLRF